MLLLDLSAGHGSPTQALGPVAVELGSVAEQLVAAEAAVQLGARVLAHVAVELVQALRDALAYVARVGERGPRALRVGVLAQGPARVLAGVAVVREGLLAARAVVALDRPVRELVHAQEVGLAEGLAADVTLEGLLPCVDPHVPDQGRLETERLAAILTDFLHFGFGEAWFGKSRCGLEGRGVVVEARRTLPLDLPLQGVTLDMLLELPAGKPPPANLASLKPVILSVSLEVKVEVRVFAEGFVALGALVRPLSRVDALVDDKLGRKLENLAAVSTF